MNTPERRIYRFEDVEVDALSGYLRRNGEERHLRQKTFQVLVYLLEHRGADVTKDELINYVWKDTAVVDDVLVQSVKDIRRALGDDKHSPRFIRTIPKVGYRFIGEVESPKSEVQNLVTAAGNQNSAIDKSPPAITSRLVLFSIFLFVVLSVVLGFVWQNAWRTNNQNKVVSLPNQPGKKSLVVMFFENQSNSAELDWLRAGLADMLITDFSRSERLTVLSRGQLRLLLDRMKSDSDGKFGLDEAFEVARRTGTEVIVTGSFARLGEMLRVEAQLYDVKTQNLLAAESLTVERPEQILSEINLLSIKLARHLGEENRENDANLGEIMTSNLEAYRYYSLAVEKSQALHNREAIELLEKAIALDPEFAMAHARIGYTYAVTWGWAEKAKPHLERAFALSNRLTEKDRLYIRAWYAIANLDYSSAITSFREIIQRYPTETEAYLRLGYLLRGEEQFEEAISVTRQGLTIDAESSALYNALGLLYSVLGKHAEAIAMHERYVALEPLEANAHDSLGMSYQWAGRYPEAITEYTRAVELNPNFDIARVHLASVYFQTGRYRAAIEEFKRFIAVAPSNGERALGYKDIAHVYRKQKNFKAAEQAAKQAARENEFHVWEMIALALERQDWSTVKNLEKRLLSESGWSNRGKRETLRFLFYYRGYIALKNGRPDEALDNFRSALGHAPPTWDIDALEDCLANAYLELGRLDEAILEYQRILQLNPNYPLARFHLAQAFERKGLTGEARENYQQFLQIWKDADADIPEIAAAKKFIGNLYTSQN